MTDTTGSPQTEHNDHWSLLTEFAVNLEQRPGHRHGPHGCTYVSFDTAVDVLAEVVRHRRHEHQDRLLGFDSSD